MDVFLNNHHIPTNFIRKGKGKMKDTYILGIESSCDETSVAVVKNGREVLSNIISSQVPIHEKFGGVVPEIASRNHVEAISNVTKKALKEANLNLNDIDAIACTYGPRFSWSTFSRGIICKSIKLCKQNTINRNKSYRGTHSSKLYYT